MGIEPTSSAWKAEALPLSYARNVRRNCYIIILNRYPKMQEFFNENLRIGRDIVPLGNKKILTNFNYCPAQLQLLHFLVICIDCNRSPVEREVQHGFRTPLFALHVKLI